MAYRERGEVLGPILGTTLIASFAVAFLVAILGGFDVLLDAVLPVLGVLAVAALAVGAVALGHRGGPHSTIVRRGRTVEIRTGPTRNRKITALHEAGHAVVGEARGWVVRGIEIFDDLSAVTRLQIPWYRTLDPTDDIAVSLAGWRATGDKGGCGSDFAYAEAARDSYPPEQRERRWREGMRRADAAIFWRGGEMRRTARALHTRDHL